MNGLYKVTGFRYTSLFAAPALVPADIWHQRFGHLNFRLLAEVSPVGFQTQWCEPCALAKAHRLPFSSHFPVSDEPLFRIHSNVLGPMPDASTGGGKDIVSFIDDATRYNNIFILKTKSQVFSHFVKFLNVAENVHGRQIKSMKSERGGDYSSNEFDQYLSNKGIYYEHAPSETPEQNSVDERFNRHLLEKVHSIMLGYWSTKTSMGWSCYDSIFPHKPLPFCDSRHDHSLQTLVWALKRFTQCSHKFPPSNRMRSIPNA